MPASHKKPQLTRTKQHSGQKKRKEKVENAEYQQCRQKFLALELGKSHEHRRFDDAKAARGVADRADQRRHDKDNEYGDETDGRAVRQQHVE